jgi:hypothetical protein
MNEPTPHPDAGLDALFALARSHRPDTSAAEYAFETRLMARLRAQRNTHDATSIWATVSWRFIPLFAACILALTIWQAESASDTTDAVSIASLDNPVAAYFGSN